MRDKSVHQTSGKKELKLDPLQNRLLRTELTTLSSLTQNKLLISPVLSSAVKPLSLKNSMLSSSQRPSGFRKTEGRPSKPEVSSEHHRLTDFSDELNELNKAEGDTLSIDKWSSLVTFGLTMDNRQDVEEESDFVANYFSSPRSFFDDYILARSANVRQIKMDFLQFLASSLVDGGVLKSLAGREKFVGFLEAISTSDPEFILKSALYCRRELNIRTTANALLACACYDKKCYPFIDKYFCAILSLPSDWIEVAEYFQSMVNLHSRNASFPKPMRRNMVKKFAEFDEYQLAKYTKEKGRSKRAKESRLNLDRLPNPEGSHPFLQTHKLCLTMKHLIKSLHIRLPTFPVMCILGKKYPSSATEFVRLGLEGTWDPTLAGKRMKLPSPVTWETELSKNGNNNVVWESLITSNRVPYMAMLRNLRNIIKCGVSSSVQEEVIMKLTNPNAVISSKLFPFRFFTAYVVLRDLQNNLMFNTYLSRLYKNKNRVRSARTQLRHTKLKRKEQKYLEMIREKGVTPLRYTMATLNSFREALGKAIAIAVRNNLPPIRGNTLIVCCFQSEQNTSVTNQLQAAGLGKNVRAIGVLLAYMCASICESSTTYVVMDDLDQCRTVLDLVQLGREGNGISGGNILSKAEQLLHEVQNLPSFSLQECLSDYLAIGHEFDTVYLIGDMNPAVADFVSLQRAQNKPLNAVWSNLSRTDTWPDQHGDKSHWAIMKGPTDQVLRYIAEASDQSLVNHVEHMDDLYGLTQPLHVKLPNNRDQNAVVTETLQVSRPITTDWRCCRIFISSTFRDMHAERDLICGLMMPTLRQYAAQELHVHVLEVDLRWGVPEASTQNSRALEMCLDQAAKSDLFVLLLGNRYGWTPKKALLDVLPERLQQIVAKFYRPGMSITEMEYNMAKWAAKSRVPPKRKRSSPDTEREALRTHVFAFIRDPNSLNGIPEEHALEFNEAHEAKCKQLMEFKATLRKDGVLVNDKYSASFNGIIDHRPVMGDLDAFGTELYETLHDALGKLYRPELEMVTDIDTAMSRESSGDAQFIHLYVEPVASSISPRQLLALERAASEMTARGEQCHALRALAAEKKGSTTYSSQINQKGHDGTVLLITGSIGCGKTTHLAALAMCLHTRHWKPSDGKPVTELDVSDLRESLLPRNSSSVVATARPIFLPHRLFMHFTDGLALTGLPPKSQLISLLDHWIDELIQEINLGASICDPLAKKLNTIREELGNSLTAAKESLLKFKMSCLSKLISLLQVFPNRSYAFLLDAADHLRPPLLDWIPTVLPSNVRVILTCDAGSTVARHLVAKPDCLAYTVTLLSMSERTAAVRAILGRYGKVLSESGFRNQLSLLVNKRHAEIPFYLKLACEELRLYGTYQELDAQLKMLPDTIPQLVHHIVARAQSQSGTELVLTALALLACSRRPLSTTELYNVLDGWLQDRQRKHDDPSPICPWRKLLKLSTSENAQLETAIGKLIIGSQKSLVTMDRRQVHIPPLAFHVLLAGIRPLLAGLGEEEDLTETTETQIEQLKFASPQFSLLRLRNSQLVQLIDDICFNVKTEALSSYSRLGYYKTTTMALISSSSVAKRLRPTTGSDDPDESARSFSGKVDRKYIHWLLATNLTNLEYKIYHFFHAGQLDIVFRLLLSPSYLSERLRLGQGSLLLEDYHGYVTSDLTIQDEWTSRTHSGELAHKLSAMRQFIATNILTLTRYPFLFLELAANYEADSWIRQLGLRCMQSITNSNSDSNPDRPRLLVRCSQFNNESKSRMTMPYAIHHPVEKVTVVALSPDGKLIVYGTQSGTITLVNATTMQELRSFYGHSGAVFSLCFLTNNRNFSNIGAGQTTMEHCLASTAQDQTVCLWLLPSLGGETESSASVTIGRSLTSWSGPQKQAITSSAWHPDRGLLATGSLDCTVVLWNPPRSIQELNALRAKSSADDTRPPYSKILQTHFSPVSSLAFRPGGDDLAVGCWDGTVRIFNIVNFHLITCVGISSSAICSLDYSIADNGTILATQDIKGALLLLRSSDYSVLVKLKRNSLRNSEDLADPTLVPWLFRRGQVCFSRPSGRYLIQSGGFGCESGQLLVWNAHLGEGITPWNSSQFWQTNQKRPQKITACTSDPYGQVLLVGNDEGRFAIVCAQSGRTLTTKVEQICTVPDNSTIWAVSCVLRSPEVSTVKTKQFRYAAAVVTSSGFLVRFTFGLKFNSLISVMNGRDQTQLEDLSVDNSSSLTHGSGGLLTVDMTSRFLATGSENATAYILIDKSLHTLSDMGGSAVISTAACEDYVAFGSKDRCVRVFKIKGASNPEHLTTIYGAANDWITTLSWGSCYSPNWQSLFLVVGSNDEQVRMYKTKSDDTFYLSETLQGPGGSVTTVSCKDSHIVAGSAEGYVRLWEITKDLSIEVLTTMDLSADVSGAENQAGIMCANLFETLQKVPRVNGLSKSIRNNTSSRRHHPKPESCSEEVDIFARMDVDGLLEDSKPRDGWGDQSPPSNVDLDESGDELMDIGSEDPFMTDVTRYTTDPTRHRQNDARGQRASKLRLIVGQKLAVSREDHGNLTQFRFRTYAPLLLELRSALQGHQGLIANSLSTAVDHTGEDSECMLVSVAQPSDGIGRHETVGCDIRLWKLPNFGSPKQDMPIQHNGPITGLTYLCLPDRAPWIVSAGADGCLIYWRLELNTSSCNEGSTVLVNQLVWVPSFRMVCSDLQITDISAFSPPPNIANLACLCFVTGRKLVVVGLSDLMMRNLEVERVVKLEQLLVIGQPGIICTQIPLFEFATGIVLESGSSHDGDMEIVLPNIYGARNKVQLSITDFIVSFIYHGPTPFDPSSPLFSLGPSVYTLNYNSRQMMVDILCPKTVQGENGQLSRFTLSDGRLIRFIEPISHGSNSDMNSDQFLIVSELDGRSIVDLIDGRGKISVRLQSVPRPVTAICSLASHTLSNRTPWYFAIATSDGLVWLLKRDFAQPDRFVEVDVCPTGERITKLKLLRDNRMQLIAGTQSGTVLVYEVI